MKLIKNQILEEEVLETNMMGFGVCKANGAVIFVQNAVAGDRAKVRVIKCAKNYYVGRIEELLEASPFRIKPGCECASRCGGCSFQHIKYEHELELKTYFVKNCFKRAGLSEIAVLPAVSSGAVSGYRNKGQYPVSADEDGKVISGFYSPKTHKVCPVKRCDIQDESFSPITKHLCDYFTRHQVKPYSEDTGNGLVRHIYLRKGKATGEIMLCLVLKEDSFPREDDFVREVTKAFPEIKSISFNIQPANTNVILGSVTRTVFGPPKISDTLCGKTFQISPASFYQVNHDGAELLYKTAFSMAKMEEYDHIVDLYCGIGTISLCSGVSKPISGVEIVPEAVLDAKENALQNGIHNARFTCGDAADAFRILKDSGAKRPLLILDPPRKGLSENLISDIASHGVSDVLYISCNPETFARDLSRFHTLGYRIGMVQPVDLFPRTSHVECVVLMSRN